MCMFLLECVKWHNCISYVWGHRMKWVCVNGCSHSPFLVNGWWTRYLGQRPIEFHGLHGCKLTLCSVLIVRAQKMGQRPN